MSNTNISILPVIKSEWQGQLNALKNANETTNKAVRDIEFQISKNSTLATTLQPQLEKAQLAQWEAVRKYNSFVESGSQLLKVATDAEYRLNRSNLSLLERNQLETTRDTMVNLASEFITFKNQNGVSLQSLSPMNIGSKTYYHDGRVEWNTATKGGYAGQSWESIKGVAAGVTEALLKGPMTIEFQATVPSRLSSSPTVQPPCSAACGSASTKLSDIMRGNPKFHWATFTGSARLSAACDIQAAAFDSAARIAGVPACAMSANGNVQISASQAPVLNPWAAHADISGCLGNSANDRQWGQVA